MLIPYHTRLSQGNGQRDSNRAVASSGRRRVLVGVQRAKALCWSARCPRFILPSHRRRRQNREFATALSKQYKSILKMVFLWYTHGITMHGVGEELFWRSCICSSVMKRRFCDRIVISKLYAQSCVSCILVVSTFHEIKEEFP